MARAVGGRLIGTTVLGNLVGGLLTYFYFRAIDYRAIVAPRADWREELAYFAVSFAVIAALGVALGLRWRRPLESGGEPAVVRRRALLMPFMLAGLSAVGWLLAGVAWGAVWPLLTGTFAVADLLRSLFGTTVLAGSVATALIFFVTEHEWRKRLPAYFPAGDLSQVRGVIRLPVRVRLLVIFLGVSIIPLSIVSVGSYTRAAALLHAPAAAAPALVHNLLLFVLFMIAAGSGGAVALALYVSASVAGPLRELEAAMVTVGGGRLDACCRVVSNDELGAVAEGFNRMAEGLREREFIRETFGKYVSPEIRDEILAGRIALEGQVVEVTLLFADLRDFTPWVESSDPREVVRDLNAYFTEMEDAIRRHQGLVLQFIGDEIEAVFGAPIARADHADLAARAALEMRQRLLAWNARRQLAGRAILRHGIGIHTGRVLAANIGSRERLSYALVGDPVNLASRIQALSKDFGTDILISAPTRRRLDGTFELAELPAVRVKGKSTEVEVYRLVG